MNQCVLNFHFVHRFFENVDIVLDFERSSTQKMNRYSKNWNQSRFIKKKKQQIWKTFELAKFVLKEIWRSAWETQNVSKKKKKEATIECKHLRRKKNIPNEQICFVFFWYHDHETCFVKIDIEIEIEFEKETKRL